MSSTSFLPQKVTKRRNNSIKQKTAFAVTDKPVPAKVKLLPVAKKEELESETDLEWCEKQANNFMRCFKKDYEQFIILYKYVIHEEQEKERQNIQELDEMRRIFNRMQVEKSEVKRKRWCRYCQSEATYQSTSCKSFYCSKECEKKQNDFSNTIQESFNNSI